MVLASGRNKGGRPINVKKIKSRAGTQRCALDSVSNFKFENIVRAFTLKHTHSWCVPIYSMSPFIPTTSWMPLLKHVPFKNRERWERFRAFQAVARAFHVFSQGLNECSVVREVHLHLWLSGSRLQWLRFCYWVALGPFPDAHVFWVTLKKTFWWGVGKLTSLLSRNHEF